MSIMDDPVALDAVRSLKSMGYTAEDMEEAFENCDKSICIKCGRRDYHLINSICTGCRKEAAEEVRQAKRVFYGQEEVWQSS